MTTLTISSIEKKFFLGAFGILALLIAIEFFSILTLSKLIKQFDNVTRIHLIIEKLEETISNIKDTETGSRGYIITGNPEFLKPYLLGKERVTSDVRQLEKLLVSKKNIDGLARLQSLIQYKIDFSEKLINIKKSTPGTETFTSNLLNTGKSIMDSIRFHIYKMQNEERKILAENERIQKSTIKSTKLVIFINSMLAFSIVLLSLLLLRKDMEGKKIAEDKLMQSEQILNEAQKIAKIGHWEINVATGTLTISEALNEILNTPDRSSGLSTIENFYKLLSPDESDRLRRELNTCIATGVGYETDYTVVLKNGAQKIISNKVLPQVDEHGKVKVVRGTSQDITESRSFDIALRKSEKRFSTIFHLNPLPAVITRIKDGKILLNNKKASELFGFAATDLEDATTIQLKAWKNIEEKTMIINDPKAKNLVQVENTYHTKLGRVFKAITNIERIEIDGEECMLAIIQDIDDLKKKEESIRNYSMELERLNNNQVKFLAIIAHDLMSPVNGLIGCSNLLEDDTDNLSHDEIKQLSKAINTSSTNLKTLLSNLLAWANNHSGHLAFTPTKLSLEAVVESELLLLKDVLNQKSIQIRKSLPVNCELMADENMLHTILRNFITNAIKFSYGGGVIEILATSEKDRIYISIVDKGVGMEESVQKKLFRIETKNSEVGTFGEKGSGLGLHLCKEFVEMHGGEVFVESERGVGTTFSFSLPGNCEV